MTGNGQDPSRAEGTARTFREGRSRSIGEVLDETRWDRRPDDDALSPLVSVDRYFRDFPWNGVDDGWGDGVGDGTDAEAGAPQEEAPAPEEGRPPWPGEA